VLLGSWSRRAKLHVRFVSSAREICRISGICVGMFRPHFHPQGIMRYALCAWCQTPCAIAPPGFKSRGLRSIRFGWGHPHCRNPEFVGSSVSQMIPITIPSNDALESKSRSGKQAVAATNIAGRVASEARKTRVAGQLLDIQSMSNYWLLIITIKG
jgi:hypothetical protein